MPARAVPVAHPTVLHPRKRQRTSTSTLPHRSQPALSDSDDHDDQVAGDHSLHYDQPTRRQASSSREPRRSKSRSQAAVTGAAHRPRRDSLPRPASPRPRQRPGASPVASTSRTTLSAATQRQLRANKSLSDDKVTQHPSVNKQRRAGKALTPLPTNHTAPRSITMPSKRTRDPEAVLVAPRMTRRSSGALLLPEEPREELVRGRKRKRQVKIISDIEMDAEGHEEDEEEEGASDVEMGEQRGGAGRRLRSAGAREVEEDGAREGDDEEEGSEHEQDGDAAGESGEEGELDVYCLEQASAKELRSLTRPELSRIHAEATGSSSNLNKEQLIQGILSARIAKDGHDATTSGDETSDVDSPRPHTSHEASPVVDSRSRKGKGPRRKGGKRQNEQHVPTPPHSSGSDLTSQGEDDIEEPVVPRNLRILRNRSQSLPDVGSRPSSDPSKKSGRQSHVEPPRRQLRTRRDSLNEEELAAEARELRNGKKVVRGSPEQSRKVVKFDAVAERSEGEEEDEQKTSPVAHRTRHGATPSSPVASPESRPTRSSKTKNTGKRSLKGKEKATDQGDSDDELVDVPSDEGEEEDDGDEEMVDAGQRPSRTRSSQDGTATVTSKRRGGRARSQQLVEAPPSDADEESGAEPDDEQSEDGEEEHQETMAEVVSHLRASKQLRNGKVVALKTAFEDEEEDEDEEMDDADGDTHEDDIDLEGATERDLQRYRRDELVRACEERDLQGEGTKRDLIKRLFEWRETQHSGGSDSDTSTATARAETKTQALDAIKTARPGRKSKEMPLLMRQTFSSSPEKPHSPIRSKADEQEEVNALDLESLQLQDKEIAPEKLTKLEKVGSGGFKDVYKGIYRKKTIAIADIRGHLTDMDIKELGLLRDLRHPNIVHFIGVSIPKEPSSVPVMIVTELCANGDLFDYLRGVSHPPFISMLEIMLGISRGLEYLHTHKPIVIHRDIKSSNVLITADGVAKLNDFGLARIKTSTRSMIRSLVGTVNWQAPELWVAHPKYNEKVDVYSVGLVFWEVLQWHQPVKRYPFEGLNEHAIYDQVGHKKLRPSTASMRRAWGGGVVDLVSAMWDENPASRPPMSQITLEIGLLMTEERERMAQEKRDRGRA